MIELIVDGIFEELRVPDNFVLKRSTLSTKQEIIEQVDMEYACGAKPQESYPDTDHAIYIWKKDNREHPIGHIRFRDDLIIFFGSYKCGVSKGGAVVLPCILGVHSYDDPNLVSSIERTLNRLSGAHKILGDDK